MALAFPSTPTDGQIYNDSTSGSSYIYNAAYGVWLVYPVQISLNSDPGYVYANTVNVTAVAAFNKANLAFAMHIID